MWHSGPARITAGAARCTLAAALVCSMAAGSRPTASAEEKGAIRTPVRVADDRMPALANLDPRLRRALRRAARDAARERIDMVVNGGWRSRAHQQRLVRDAVARYGSAEEAARWVAPPDRSAHVSGDAVDIGPARATAWLARHGAAYGLCRIYRNEPWHFELRPDAIERGCPAMYADPTRDPRMQP